MDTILQAIPHRPPFLFVDEIVSIDDERIEARRFVSPDEAFFKGHYPDFPLMPGVLVCEAIFQAGAILLARQIDGAEGGVPVLTRIGGARFRGAVRPGDTLTLQAWLDERVGEVFALRGAARVEGKKVVTVEFTCALVAPEKLRG